MTGIATMRRLWANTGIGWWGIQGVDVTRASDGAALVVFDGDCAFCTSSISWLTHAFPGSFDVVPYQRTDLEALGLTTQQCQAKLQWLTDSAGPSVAGSRLSGAQAVTEILRTGGRDRGGPLGTAAWVVGVLGSFPPGSWVAAAVYVVVAANRSRLPGGTPACRVGATHQPPESAFDHQGSGRDVELRPRRAPGST